MCMKTLQFNKIPYQINTYKSIKYLNEEELLKIKNQAYNYGILDEDVMSIFGILLRNYILKKKNMSIYDVDKKI